MQNLWKDNETDIMSVLGLKDIRYQPAIETNLINVVLEN